MIFWLTTVDCVVKIFCINSNNREETAVIPKKPAPFKVLKKVTRTKKHPDRDHKHARPQAGVLGGPLLCLCPGAIF